MILLHDPLKPIRHSRLARAAKVAPFARAGFEVNAAPDLETVQRATPPAIHGERGAAHKEVRHEPLAAGAMSRILYGVAATGPGTYGAVALLLVAVAAAASWIPARRAVRIDPIVVLREE